MSTQRAGGEKIRNSIHLQLDKDIDRRKFYLTIPFVQTSILSVVYPLGLLKTRFQVQRNTYRNIGHAIRVIAQTEGLRALYKGFGTNLLNLINGPVYVTTFEVVRLLTRQLGCNPDSPKVALFAGGIAATIEEATGTPIDNIVKRRQVTVEQLKSPLTTVRELYVADGFRGFYRGYSIALMMFAPSSALSWFVFTLVESWLARQCSLGERLRTPIAGVCSGITIGIVLCPLDVVRTQKQLVAKEAVGVSNWSLAHGLWKTEGVRGFFRGLAPRTVQTSIACSLLFSAYSSVKRLCRIDSTDE